MSDIEKTEQTIASEKTSAPPSPQQSPKATTAPAKTTTEVPVADETNDFVSVSKNQVVSQAPLLDTQCAAIITPLCENIFGNVVILGSTGETGKWITKELLSAPQVDHVYTFVRSVNESISHPKLTQSKFTFDLINDNEETIVNGFTEIWPNVDIDSVFTSLGTTIKQQGGSEEKFYKIDYTTNYLFAKVAKDKNVKQFHLVSSASADSSSSMFYLRTKGQLENSIKDLQFPYFAAYRPGILDGVHRPEGRLGESVALWTCNHLLWWLNGNLLYKARPIHVHDVARSMVRNWAQRFQLENTDKNILNTPETQIFDGSTPILQVIDDMEHVKAAL